MKKLSKILSATALAVPLSVPGVAVADDWFQWLKITGILLHDDSLEVTLSGTDKCNRIFRLHTNEQNYDVKASALLAAYYSGHSVSLYYSGDLDSCSTKLHRFKVKP